MKKKRYSKRVLSLILSILMIVSIIPIGMVQASAASLENCSNPGSVNLFWPTGNNQYIATSDPMFLRNLPGTNPWHWGFDIPVAYGSPVYAVYRGTVWYANAGPADCNIAIKHFDLYNGDVFSYYFHMSKVVVSYGQVVEAGQLIGYSGDAHGQYYGPHLHLEFGRDYYVSGYGLMNRGTMISPNPAYESVYFTNSVSNTFSRDKYIQGPFNYVLNTNLVGPVDPVEPGKPQVRIDKTDAAYGEKVRITWDAVSNAKHYYVFRGNELCSDLITNNKSSYEYYVSTKGLGTENFYVSACNGPLYTDSDIVCLTSHKQLTVTFKNWDGTVYEYQKVDYGEKAVAPSSNPPEREGYTFNGWEGIDTPVYADKVINAQYTRNKYLVNFYKYVKNADGTRTAVKLGNTQKIYYGEDAVAPDASTFDLPDGHVFAGWSDKYENIKENKNIYLVDKWYNDNMSVLVSDLVAIRDDDGTGYTVTLKVTNNDTAITSGRVIVALKTSEEKLVETTESSAFSLKAGKSKELEIFIPSTRAASVVDAFAVEKFETAIPISVTQRANITVDENNLWTDWSTEAPPADALNIQTKTQYRYRDKDIKTSGYDTLEGYIWYDQQTTTSTDPNLVRSVPTDSTTYDGKKTYSAVTYYEYGLYGWTFDNGSDWTYAYGRTEAAALSGGKRYYPNRNEAQLRDQLRYFWVYDTSHNVDSYHTTRVANFVHLKTGQTGTYNVVGSDFYYVRDLYKVTTTTTLNYFYKWLDWSDWSDSSATASAERDVEERTVYRYIPASAIGIEDNSGIQRHINGDLSSEYAGQQATLFVYKYDEASDWTNEYVGQCIIATDGTYSFDFILRDEPTVRTGDYKVTLGIEGTDMVLNLAPIKAPIEQFTVNYYDAEGSIISTQTVNKGDSAVIPDVIPEQVGYTFTGWSESNTAIKENLDIFPVMQINTYNVVFIDWEHQTYEMQQFNYGDSFYGPYVQDTEDKYFTGWDVVNNGTTIVTENLVACAQFETKTFDVKFYDWDGNEIKSGTVEYGGQVAAPELEERDGYIFDGWSTYDYYFVKDSLDIYPVFHFENTVENPTADIDTGIYDETQTVTLSCATEGAEIYYTVDGSDPAENGTLYTAPIEIAKSTTLKFVAKKTENNNSNVITKCYAINKADMGSEWMTFAELPQEVVDNPSEYTMLSNIGYKYKDTMSTTSVELRDQLLADGWTIEDTGWTDYSEYSQTYPEYPDNEIEILSRDGDLVEKFFYNYSHYKYVDADTGETVCKPSAVEGTSGEIETIKLDNVLTVSKFVDGKAGYSYNGELWFNQEVTSEMVDPGFDVYSYRSKVFNLYKWTDWNVTAHSTSDTRERQSDTVFKYIVPNEYIVTLDYSKSELTGKQNEIMLVREGKTVSIEDNYFDATGYTFDGLFTDENCTDEWDIENDTVSQSVTLYSKHTMQTFTVRFLNYDGAVISEQTVQYLNFAQIPEDPQRDGYVFVGWTVTAGSETGNEGITSDVDYTAQYVAEEDYVRVSLSRSRLSLATGSSAKINVILTSGSASDSEIYLYSSNSDVATVEQDGTITAVHSGTAIITALSLDTYESANCVVTVLGTPDTEILPVSNSGVFVDASAKYLLGLTVSNNTIESIGGLLENTGLIYTNADGSVVYDETDSLTHLGTGFRIRLEDNGLLIDELEIVVYGDINGDGAFDAFDLFNTDKVINSILSVGGVYETAVDADGDGTISLSDYTSLKATL